IDTQLHLIYRDRLSYPWLKGVAARATPRRRCDAASPTLSTWRSTSPKPTSRPRPATSRILRFRSRTCFAARSAPAALKGRTCAFPLADDAPISLQSKKTEFLAIEVDGQHAPGYRRACYGRTMSLSVARLRAAPLVISSSRLAVFSGGPHALEAHRIVDRLRLGRDRRARAGVRLRHVGAEQPVDVAANRAEPVGFGQGLELKFALRP